MKVTRLLGVFLMGIAMSLALGSVHAQQAGSMLDGNLLAAEVGTVNLVTNGSGRVVQVRVEDCGQCDRDGYLPSPKLKITQPDNPAFSGNLSELNGQGGTVVVDLNSGMVVQVIFWMPRGDRG